MTPQAPPQTVEDLGKLVKSKYPGTYDSLSDVDVGTKVKTKYPDAYGHFTDVQEKPKPPESTFSKLKGKIYDPTLGSIGQGARDVYGELTDPVNKSGGIVKGAHEMISGGENTLLPVAAAAAITNPEVTLPAMALGAAGQAAGKYIPKMFGASEDVSNLTGDIAGLAAGGLGAKEGPRISSAAKVAAPDVAAGLGKAGVGMATGAAMHGLGVPGSEFSTALMTRPGLKQAGQGLVAGARELLGKGVKASDLKVESPSKVTPPKGPSVGELKTAVKNGILTPEQFDAHVDQMNLTDTAKNLHKADVRVPNKADASIGPVESPKTLNIGQLERLVKIGRLDPEKFNARLVGELKYKPEDAEHLTELLKKQIEDEKEEGEEGEKSKKVESPKSPKGPGEVKSPLESKIVEPNLQAPGSESFLETEAPYKPPITEHQIEESQSTARKAKETTLARYFVKNKTDLTNIPKTSEYLQSVGNEAGLKRTPSLRTLENAIKMANELRGSERGSLSLRDLKVDNPTAKLTKLFSESDKTMERPPLPGETPKTNLTPPSVPGKLVGRTTGKEMPESAQGRYGAGFGIYDIPIEKIQGTEDISSNASKMQDAKSYADKTKSGSEAPPLWGHVDAQGNVVIMGARRLEAARQLGQKTIKVAIGQDYQKSQ